MKNKAGIIIAILIISGLSLYLVQSKPNEDNPQKQDITAQQNNGDNQEPSQISSTGQAPEPTQSGENAPKPQHQEAVARDESEKDGVRIFGKVVFSDTNKAANGAKVGLNARFRDRTLYKETFETDLSGAFSFTVSQPGTYHYFAETETHAFLRYPRGQEPRGEHHGHIHINEDTQEYGPLTIQIEPVTPLTVTVLDKNTGLPIEGAIVTSSDGRIPEYVSDKDGQVHMMLGSFSWDLTAKATGYNKVSKSVDLSSDMKQTTIELGLGGSIFGKVVDENDQAIEGVTVNAIGMNYFAEFSNTNAEGKYRLDHIPTGSSFQLYVFHKSYETSSFDKVQLPESGELEQNIKLIAKPEAPQGEGVFLAQIVDETGEPLEDFNVTADGPEGEVPVSIGGEGHITMKGLTLETTYQLLLEAPGFRKKSVSGKPFKEDEAKVIPLVMLPGHSLAGRVTDENGAPLVATLEVLMGQNQETGHSDRSLSDGNFYMDELPDKVGLKVSAQGYSTKIISNLTLDLKDLKVTLSPSSLLRGQVLDKETNEPVQTFQYHYRSADLSTRMASITSIGNSGFTETVNKNGEFVIGNVDEGTQLRLEFKAEGYQKLTRNRVKTQPYAIAKDQVVKFYMEPITRYFQVLVMDSDSNPIPDVETTLITYPKDQFFASTMYTWHYFEMMHHRNGESLTSDHNGLMSFAMPPEEEDGMLFLQGAGIARTSLDGIVDRMPGGGDPIVITVFPQSRILGTCNIEKYPRATNINIKHVDRPGLNWSTSVDPSGSFILDGIPEGMYELTWSTSEGMGMRTAEVIEKSTLTIETGEDLEVRLGFEETHTLHGVAQMGGAPLSQGVIYLLAWDMGGAQKYHVGYVKTDEAGRFTFENLKNGNYELVAFEEDKSEYQINTLNHPNRQKFTIEDVDISQQFNFQRFARISGSYANTEKARVFLLNMDENANTQYHNSFLRAGRFQLKDIPPGLYNLHLSIENGSTKTIASNLQVRLGEDQDLGELSKGKKGAIEVIVDNISDGENGSLRISGDGDGFPITQQIQNGTNTIIDGIPAGPVTISALIYNPENMRIADAVSVKVVEGKTTQVALKLRPLTYLVMRCQSLKIVKARMIGETTFDLPVLSKLSATANPFDIKMGIMEGMGFVMDLTPGTWTVETTLSSGDQSSQTVEVAAGKMTQLVIDF